MRTLLIVLTLLFGLSTQALAQEPANPPTAPDPMASLLEVMKDETARNRLIQQLEQAQAATGQGAPAQAEPGPTADAPATDAPAAENPEAVFSDQGLATGLVDWLHELGGRLPSAALGAPIDVKLRQAEIQLEQRLAVPDASQTIQGFVMRSLPGWALATLAAVGTLLLVRRRIRRRVTRDAPMGQVAREGMLRVAMSLLPTLAGMLVAALWPALLHYSDRGAILFVLLAMPLVAAVTASELSSALLLLLAPSKGWRLVAYAQRKLSPQIGLLVGVATGASVMGVMEMRLTIGPAPADIAKLLLDLAVPLIALFIVIRNRRVARSLIVRGHTPDHESSALDRAIYWVGTNWHWLGIAFVVLNIGARLFGAQTGSFLTQSFLSVALIVIALILSTMLERLGEPRKAHPLRRQHRTVRSAVFERLRSVLARIAQVVMAFFVVTACVQLWGVNFGAWAESRVGAAVLGPLVAIGLVMLAAWTLWVLLDSWITEVLSPENAPAGRQRSARVMTLLPLLRNFAFVALSVLTVMGVLSNLGINIAPLIAGAGVIGLAIGFGSQQLVQDVITGLFILLEDSIAIGDVINVGDRSGQVEALTIRTVKVRDGDGALHSIPFSTIKALKNSSRGFGVYTASITLDIDADLERALEIFEQAGEDVRKDPLYAPKVIGRFDVSGVDQVGLDGIVIKGSIKTLPLQQYGVGCEINRRVREDLQAAGIPLARRTVAPKAVEQAA